MVSAVDSVADAGAADALDGATGGVLWTANADGLSTTPAADATGVYMALTCGPI